MFNVAPVLFWTKPRSDNVNGVFAVGILEDDSLAKPVTFTPNNLPLFKPALSISVPVLVFVPT